MMPAEEAIAKLRAHPTFWGSRAREISLTGFPVLEALLPHAGWPVGALTELLVPRDGIGELRLLLPALAHVSREGRWLAWISPPYLPFGPALSHSGVDLSKLLLIESQASNDALWAAEQALASGACGAVLAWPDAAAERSLRRLQLAAERGRSLGFLFSRAEAARRPSPAALRLALKPRPEGLRVQVLKGGWGEATVSFRGHEGTERAIA